MDEIPMDVTIKAMQAQIDELKRIVASKINTFARIQGEFATERTHTHSHSSR